MFFFRGAITARREEDMKVAIEFGNRDGEFEMLVLEEYLEFFKDFAVGRGIILSADESEICGITRDSAGRGKADARAGGSTSSGAHPNSTPAAAACGPLQTSLDKQAQDLHPCNNSPELIKPVRSFVYSPSILLTLDTTSTISNLSRSSYIDLRAVVVSCKPLIETKGTDYLFTLGIADETGSVDLRVFVSGPEDLGKFVGSDSKIDFSIDFKREDNFNRIFRPGDILHIRNIKLGQGGKMALVHKSCSIAKIANAVDARDDVSLQYSISAGRNCQLVSYFVYFYNNFHSERMAGAVRNGKDKSIAALERNSYANVVGRVLFIEHGYVTSVCITDFTHNPSFPATRKGKFSLDMLLYINVFGRHAGMLRDVKIGDVCRFENVKVRDLSNHLSSHMSESKHGSISVVQDALALSELREREVLYYRRNSLGMNYARTEDSGSLGHDGAGIAARNDRTDNTKNRIRSNAKASSSANSGGILQLPYKANNTHTSSAKNTKACGSLGLDRLITPELVEGACNGTFDAEVPFAFSAIKSIKKPGVYLVKCRVHNYTLQNTENGPCLLLTLRDTDDTMKVMARQRLAKLLINSRLLSMNLQFMCMMILCLDVERTKNYLINTFFEDEGLADILGKNKTSLH